MHLEVGLGEMFTVIITLIAAFWGLLKLNFSQFAAGQNDKFTAIKNEFSQFELRQDDKLAGIKSQLAAHDNLLLDVKRLELELVKRDAHYAQLFPMRPELDRILGLLNTMNDKLDSKISREECTHMMHQLRSGQ